MKAIKRKRLIYKAYGDFKKLNDKIKKEITNSFKKGLLNTTIGDLKLSDIDTYKAEKAHEYE